MNTTLFSIIFLHITVEVAFEYIYFMHMSYFPQMEIPVVQEEYDDIFRTA